MPRHSSSRRRLILASAAVAAAAVLVMLAGVYTASVTVPEFYGARISPPDVSTLRAGKRLVRKVSAARNAWVQSSNWQLRLTEEEINGWLSTDLESNHAGLLPSGVGQPRIALRGNCVSVGYQESRWIWPLVISMDVEICCPEPDLLLLTIVRVRAGTMPLPLGKVLEGITTACRALGCALHWRRDGAHPAAAIHLDGFAASDERVVRVTDVALENGAISIRGVACSWEVSAETRSQDPRPRVASASSLSQDSQVSVQP